MKPYLNINDKTKSDWNENIVLVKVEGKLFYYFCDNVYNYYFGFHNWFSLNNFECNTNGIDWKKFLCYEFLYSLSFSIKIKKKENNWFSLNKIDKLKFKEKLIFIWLIFSECWKIE